MSLSKIEPRLAAARRAVLAQTELLHREFSRAESHWKADGTRVTPVDIAISEVQGFRGLWLADSRRCTISRANSMKAWAPLDAGSNTTPG